MVAVASWKAVDLMLVSSPAISTIIIMFEGYLEDP